MAKKVIINCKGNPNAKVQQHLKNQCDVNQIVDKARRQGMIAHLNERQPMYADISKVPDYETAFNIVVTAQENFMQLPAKVRERFKNDPAEMLKFLERKENYDEAVALGMVQPKVVDKTESVSPKTMDKKAESTEK